MTEWINNDKQQPKEDGHYLVCLHIEAPDILGGNHTSINVLRWTDKGWRLPIHSPKWINDEIEQKVTYWQPLPEMPDEQKENPNDQ